MKNQPFPKKLRNAFAGIRVAWTAERNFRIEVVLALVTLGAFAIVRPAAPWWALIVLCVALVLVTELANSAMEALADHLHPEIHPIIGKVKDMLAGMVLVMSLGAAAVAAIALYATLTA
ncbi:diacylglycerol kinase [Azoarcus sp. DN11]|uniref:diacylglycerol kinase n=1 Tax=Azoarcus sp. DN11 TaxID=356837 RepID=UPI000EB5117E|nr:diacylglycerol kinase [Azoarcus sp. DN11]AYH45688.1 diacylglycerol kinase [Azoarcus sp. DN11]